MCSIFGNKLDQQFGLNALKMTTMIDDTADKNNNSNSPDEEKSTNTILFNCVKEAKVEEDDESMPSPDDENSQGDCILDLSRKDRALPVGHVTLEALQNTKVAVAQFAATAIGNSKNYEEAIQDLAAVHSTLFSLQHQQLMQIQLIHQLQSQLHKNGPLHNGGPDVDHPEIFSRFNASGEKSDEEEAELEDDDDDANDESYMPPSYARNGRESNAFVAANRLGDKKSSKVRLKDRDATDDSRSIASDSKNTKDKKSDSNKSKSNKLVHKKAAAVATDKSDADSRSVAAEEKSVDSLFQTPLCHISSSLASSIITNHDPPPAPDEPNSLEMLQKRTQEVLDSASQSLLASNLAEELAFRRDSMSTEGGKDGIFKHRCRYCGKIFGSDSALQIHIRSHTGERPFVCNVCGSKFTTKGNLKVHYQRHTQRFPDFPIMSNGQANDQEYICEGGAGPQNHSPMSSAPPPQPPQLPPPPPMTSNRPPNPLNGHLSLPFPPFVPLHGFPYPPKLNEEQLRPLLTAEDEEREQEEPADLSKPCKKTSRPAADSKLFEPPKKEIKLFSEGLKISRHLEENNSQEPKVNENIMEQEEKPIQEERHKSSSRRSSVSRNTTTPEFLQERIPNLLEGTDSSWEDLIEIDKTSETSKLQQLVDNIENKLTDPNQCIFCQKVMSCRSSLQMHLRTHTGERPYRCRICGRAFATKGNLKAHMTIHKIKPPIRSQFKCPVCHQKFSNSIVLQQHIRIHTTDMTGNTSNYDRFEIDVARQLSEGRSSSVPTSEYSMGHRSSASSASQEGDFDDFTLDSENDDQMTQASSEESKTDLYRKNMQRRVVRAYMEDMERSMSSAAIEAAAAATAVVQTAAAPATTPAPSEANDEALDLTPITKKNGESDNEATNTHLPIPSIPHLELLTKFSEIRNKLNREAGSFAEFSKPSDASQMKSTTSDNEGEAEESSELAPQSSTLLQSSSVENDAENVSDEAECLVKCDVTPKVENDAKESNPDDSEEFLQSEKEDGKSSPVPHNEAIHDESNSETENSNCDRSSNRGDDVHQTAATDSPLRRRRTPSSPTFQPQHSPAATPSASSQYNDHAAVATASPTTDHNELSNPVKLLQVKDFAFTNFEDDPSDGDLEIKKSKLDPSFRKMMENDIPPEFRLSLPRDLVEMSHSAFPPPLSQMHSLSMMRSDSFQSQLQQQQQSIGPAIVGSPLDQAVNTKHYCNVCRRNFSSSSALQIHMRTHTGDKPFRCSVCQKAFTTKGNLKVHMGTHMWTNGSSRRGRRMSLELPSIQRPPSLQLAGHEPDFLQRRPDIFYPYLPPFLNGALQQKSNQPSPTFPNLPTPFHPSLASKFLGFPNPFGPRIPNLGPHLQLPTSNLSPPISDKNLSQNNNNLSPSSENSDKMMSSGIDFAKNVWNLSRHERSQSCETDKSFESMADEPMSVNLQSNLNKCSDEIRT